MGWRTIVPILPYLEVGPSKLAEGESPDVLGQFSGRLGVFYQLLLHFSKPLLNAGILPLWNMYFHLHNFAEFNATIFYLWETLLILPFYPFSQTKLNPPPLVQSTVHYLWSCKHSQSKVHYLQALLASIIVAASSHLRVLVEPVPDQQEHEETANWQQWSEWEKIWAAKSELRAVSFSLLMPRAP